MRIRYLVILTVLLSSCSLTKRLPAGATLYNGATIHAKEDRNPKSDQDLLDQLEANTLPQKNAMLFGFPYKVWVYYALGTNPQVKGIRKYLRKKFAEPPVFFTATTLQTNAQNLRNISENMGYFRPQIEGRAETKKYKTKTIYELIIPHRYYIDTVDFHQELTTLETDLNIETGSLLRSKNPYDIQTIIAERQRIAEQFQNKGYFLFDPDKIIVNVDTTVGEHQAKMELKLKEDINSGALKPYKIGDLNIYTSFDRKETQGNDTVKTDLKTLRNTGLKVNAGASRYFKPRVFEESILLRENELFSKSKQELSYNKLTNLQNFKLIRNKFEFTGDSSLTVSYFLSPMPRKNFKLQIAGQSKNNGLLGAEGGITWQNRNLFHAAENFNLNFNLGKDFQFNGTGLLNSFTRYALKAELVIPRFALFFRKLNTNTSSGIPKTSMFVSYEEQRQRSLYAQTSLNAGLAYNWRKNAEFEHAFNPLYVNLIKPKDISPEFINTVLNSNNAFDMRRYFDILDSRLLLGLTYNLNYLPSGLQDRNNLVNFNWGLDLAGNIASLIAPRNKTSENQTRNLFGVPFDQFAKITQEIKFQRKFHQLTWANRLFTGFGIPYGNSDYLPQFKQYFAGGANGLRGFRARSLGPGKSVPDDLGTSVFGNNITADIRLEFNSEWRYKMGNLVEVAGFFDTGNIWFYNEKSAYGEQGKFSKDFLNDLAADVGLGLRLDLTYLILRGDLAIPVRKPWLTENPWVFNQIRFGDKGWRRDNLIFSLAIGHPF